MDRDRVGRDEAPVGERLPDGAASSSRPSCRSRPVRRSSTTCTSGPPTSRTGSPTRSRASPARCRSSTCT
jgi:hypothetical protein